VQVNGNLNYRSPLLKSVGRRFLNDKSRSAE
jgi:hypothetical protein